MTVNTMPICPSTVVKPAYFCVKVVLKLVYWEKQRVDRDNACCFTNSKTNRCLYLFNKGTSLFFTSLEFPQAAYGHTEHRRIHSSAFSHGSWGGNLQSQGSTEVWPDHLLLNDWEPQNCLPGTWGNGSEQTEEKLRLRGCQGTEVLTQYLHHTSHSPSLASAPSWGTPCCDAGTGFWWQTEERQKFV